MQHGSLLSRMGGVCLLGVVGLVLILHVTAANEVATGGLTEAHHEHELKEEAQLKHLIQAAEGVDKRKYGYHGKYKHYGKRDSEEEEEGLEKRHLDEEEDELEKRKYKTRYGKREEEDEDYEDPKKREEKRRPYKPRYGKREDEEEEEGLEKRKYKTRYGKRSVDQVLAAVADRRKRRMASPAVEKRSPHKWATGNIALWG